MLGPWLEAGAKLDADLARDRALDLQRQKFPPRISSAFEEDLLEVIDRARQNLLI
jgi:hypothetical protein